MDLKPISIPHHNSLSIHFGYQELVLPVYLISHFLTKCLGDGACDWAFLPALFLPSSPPAWCLLPLWTEAHWPCNVTPCRVLSALPFPSSGPQRLSIMPWSPPDQQSSLFPSGRRRSLFSSACISQAIFTTDLGRPRNSRLLFPWTSRLSSVRTGGQAQQWPRTAW